MRCFITSRGSVKAQIPPRMNRINIFRMARSFPGVIILLFRIFSITDAFTMNSGYSFSTGVLKDSQKRESSTVIMTSLFVNPAKSNPSSSISKAE